MGNIKKLNFFLRFCQVKVENWQIRRELVCNAYATYFITKQPHFGVFHAKGTVVVSTSQVTKIKKYKSWNPEVLGLF